MQDQGCEQQMPFGATHRGAVSKPGLQRNGEGRETAGEQYACVSLTVAKHPDGDGHHDHPDTEEVAEIRIAQHRRNRIETRADLVRSGGIDRFAEEPDQTCNDRNDETGTQKPDDGVPRVACGRRVVMSQTGLGEQAITGRGAQNGKLRRDMNAAGDASDEQIGRDAHGLT